MVTTASNNEREVFYRLISCPCIQCLNGTLQGCPNAPFVPAWESCTLGFQAIPRGVSLESNIAHIRSTLRLLVRERTLPWFCCLGRVARQQRPAVLLMNGSIRINPNSVRCHQLAAWEPVPINDFSYTVVSKPTDLCNNLQNTCNCAKKHCVNFPLSQILEVAVVKGANHLHRSLFCKFTPNTPNQPANSNNLIHMSMSKESVQCF